MPGTQNTATLAAGCIRIAVQNMANAIKKISVQRGHDITGYALTCFGGAAGQHACLVADALGMRSVFIHPLAGVLSAYGIGLADTIVMRQQTAEVPLNAAALEQLKVTYAALEQEAGAELVQQGFDASAAQLERTVLLKYSDTDSTLTLTLLPDSTPETLAAEFLAQYRTRFGFHVPGRAIVVDTIGVTLPQRARLRRARAGSCPWSCDPYSSMAPGSTRRSSLATRCVRAMRLQAPLSSASATLPSSSSKDGRRH